MVLEGMRQNADKKDPLIPGAGSRFTYTAGVDIQSTKVREDGGTSCDDHRGRVSRYESTALCFPLMDLTAAWGDLAGDLAGDLDCLA